MNVGELRVEIGADIRGLERGLRDATRTLQRFGTQFERVQSDLSRTSDTFEAVGRQVGSFSTSLRSAGAAFAGVFAVDRLGAAASALFDLGTSAEEVGSKFSTVFGPASAGVDAFLDSFGALAGLTRTEGRAITSTLGNIFQAQGFAADASAALSQRIVRLAADMASFSNVDVTETLTAIQAALRGEFDPIERFAGGLRAASVEARALADTGKTTAKALTDQERVLATLALAAEGAGKAVGDLERTQDSLANKTRQAQAEFRSAAEALAVELLPAFNVAIDAGADLATALRDVAGDAGTDLAPAFERLTEATVDLARAGGRLSEAMGGTGEILSGIAYLADQLSGNLKTAATVADLFARVTENGQGILDGFGEGLAGIGRELGLIGPAAVEGGSGIRFLGAEAETARQQLAGLFDVASRLPNLDPIANRIALGINTGANPRPAAADDGPAPVSVPRVAPATVPKLDRVAEALRGIRVEAETLRALEALDLATPFETARDTAALYAGAIERLLDLTGGRLTPAVRGLRRQMEEANAAARDTGLADFAAGADALGDLTLDLIPPDNAERVAAVVADLARIRIGAETAASAGRKLKDVVVEAAVGVEDLKTQAELSREAFERLTEAGKVAALGLEAAFYDAARGVGEALAGLTTDLFGAVTGIGGPSEDEVAAFGERMARLRENLADAYEAGRIGAAEYRVALNELAEEQEAFNRALPTLGNAFRTFGEVVLGVLGRILEKLLEVVAEALVLQALAAATGGAIGGRGGGFSLISLDFGGLFGGSDVRAATADVRAYGAALRGLATIPSPGLSPSTLAALRPPAPSGSPAPVASRSSLGPTGDLTLVVPASQITGAQARGYTSRRIDGFSDGTF